MAVQRVGKSDILKSVGDLSIRGECYFSNKWARNRRVSIEMAWFLGARLNESASFSAIINIEGNASAVGIESRIRRCLYNIQNRQSVN